MVIRAERPFEVGIENAVKQAGHIAHETFVGRVANAVAKVTLEPVLTLLVDGPLRIKRGEGAVKYDR